MSITCTTRLWLGRCMDEKMFSQAVLQDLALDFHVYTEVKGVHFSGKGMRIDAVVTPHKPEGWKSPDVALGIEFKNDLRLRGDTTNYTGWLAQCVDYSHTVWDGFGYLYIFACPGLIAGIQNQDQSMRWLLPRIMGHLGVGELKFDDRFGLTFFLQEQHRIWSQKLGVESGKRWTLKRDFGAR